MAVDISTAMWFLINLFFIFPRSEQLQSQLPKQYNW